MDWSSYLLGLVVGFAAIGNVLFISWVRRRAYTRGVNDERKRVTIAKLGGKAEWHFRIADNKIYTSSSCVVYAQGPDGAEYVCSDYLAGINSINSAWVEVATGDTLPDAQDENLTRRFHAWRALQRTGAR